MPTTTVEYKDTPEDQQALNRAIKSTDMAIVLFELSRNGRKKFERMLESKNTTDQYDEGFSDAIDEIFDWISCELYDKGINIDELLE